MRTDSKHQVAAHLGLVTAFDSIGLDMTSGKKKKKLSAGYEKKPCWEGGRG
jgi:hypothetical protein